jgi:hypothetical protein
MFEGKICSLRRAFTREQTPEQVYQIDEEE